MALQAFQVLSEFRFEVGSALLGTKQLTGAVENLSSAADNTLFTFQKLGLGIAASMGLGTTGFLGLMGKAIQSADKFKQSQLAFVNIMGDNFRDVMTGETVTSFNDKMQISAQIMEKMNKLAAEFALPTDELVQFTKVVAPMLQAKGLAGQNFSTAIDISRNLLKSAPTLGLDPTLVQGQLLRLVEGQASMGDTLFTRLVSDTDAFAGFKKSGSKGFNTLDATKRVELLQRALKQFSSDTNVLQANVATLRGQFTLLSDAIGGTMSILRPLGDVLLRPIVQILQQVNGTLRNEGAAVVKNLAVLVESFIREPEKLLVNLMQLRELGRDTRSAGFGLGIIGVFTILFHVFRFLNPSVRVFSFAMMGLRGVFGALGSFFGMIGSGLMWITGTTTAMGALWTVFNGLIFVASRVLVPLGLMLGLMQSITRAVAIARVDDAKDLVRSMPDFTAAIAKLKVAFDLLFEPLAWAFNKVAEFIAPMFKFSYYLDIATGFIDMLANGMIMLRAGIEGVMFAILQLFDNISNLWIFGGDKGFSGIFDGVGDAMNAGMESIFERAFNNLEANQKSVMTQNVNIQKVEIRNDFKEQQEPDRIAFTIKDQLLKAAVNPSQSRGRSLSGGLVGGF